MPVRLTGINEQGFLFFIFQHPKLEAESLPVPLSWWVGKGGKGQAQVLPSDWALSPVLRRLVGDDRRGRGIREARAAEPRLPHLRGVLHTGLLHVRRGPQPRAVFPNSCS